MLRFNYQTTYPLNSANTPLGKVFACANMAVPACCKIWPRVMLAVSAAKSASMMRDLAADTFSTDVCKKLTTESKRFCTAPNLARLVFAVSKAVSIAPSAVVALAAEVTSPVIVLAAVAATTMVSPLSAPIWKVLAVPNMATLLNFCVPKRVTSETSC